MTEPSATGRTVAPPRHWQVFATLDREMVERRLRPLVTPALVDEHARHPFGPYSPALAQVLDVLRRNRGILAGKHVLVERDGHRHLGRLAGPDGGGVVVDDSVSYPSRAAAEHAIFRQRLDELDLLPADP